MAENKTVNKTLYELMFQNRNIFLDTFMILVSVAFLGVMANIQIPLWPVPITMQTFGVFAIAFFFGSRKGFLSVLAYVLAGIVGFGVFAGYKSGMAALIGPTGGYLAGFMLMAFFVGLMIENGYGRGRKNILLCMLVGETIMYILGLAGLWFYLKSPTVWQVLKLGFIPFIIGDAIKAMAAVGIFPYLWKGAEKIIRN